MLLFYNTMFLKVKIFNKIELFMKKQNRKKKFSFEFIIFCTHYGSHCSH